MHESDLSFRRSVLNGAVDRLVCRGREGQIQGATSFLYKLIRCIEMLCHGPVYR